MWGNMGQGYPASVKYNIINSYNFSDIILNSIPVLIWKTSPNHKYNYFNQTWLEFTGQDHKQAIGDGWTQGVHPNDLSTCLSINADAFKNRKKFRKEYRLRHHSGEYRWVLETGIPIYNSENEFMGFIGSCTDIQTEKQMLRNLQEAEARALESSRIRSQFLANMSHEIRTPLNGIIGMANLLSETELSDNQNEFSQDIKNSGVQLLGIVNNILDFSKIEAGKVDIEDQVFNFIEVVKQATKPFQYICETKNLRFSGFIAANIPELVRGDPGRISQIITNLMSNAVKFTNHGFIRFETDVISSNDEFVKIKFSVHDSGIGIPKNKTQKIFEPFEQADSSITRQYDGTGLGLSISKYLIEAMGGSLGMQSERNKGSTFWFSVNLGKTHTEKTIAPPQEKEIKNMYTSKRALVVEDNLINQKIAVKYLEKMGFSVLTASNGLEALEVLKNNNCDFILMDCQMPILDGYACTKEIRETLMADIPIVAMTAYALKGDREKCLNAGMDDYISKPINSVELSELIEKWVNKKSTKIKDNNMDTELDNHVRNLESEIGKESVIELFNMYKKSSKDKLEKIAKAIKDKDSKTLLFDTHQFISSSASLGATKVVFLIRELESIVKAGDYKRSKFIYDQIVLECQNFSKLIDNYLLRNSMIQ